MQTIEQTKSQLQQVEDQIDKLQDEQIRLKNQLSQLYCERLRKDQILGAFDWKLFQSNENHIVLTVYDVDSTAFINFCRALDKEPRSVKMDHFQFNFGTAVTMNCDDGQIQLMFHASGLLTPIQIFKPFALSHCIKISFERLEKDKKRLLAGLENLKQMKVMFQ